MSLDKKKAELAVLVAEEEFRHKKANGEATAEDRHALRALRQQFREEFRQPVKDGAAPDVIGAEAEVN